MTADDDGSRGAGTLAKAGVLLTFFAERGTKWSVREIAHELNLSRSTVHRLCTQLLAEEFLTYEPARDQYSWGPVMLKVSRAVERSIDTGQLLNSILESLVRETNETALLTSFDREEGCIVIARQVESTQTLLYKAEINVRSALHAGATGKSVLAFLPADEREVILSGALDAVTEATIVDPERLRRDLDRIRRDGVSVSFGERTPGAVGHASPVFDSAAQVVGSLCVTVPEYRHSAQLEQLIRRRLLHYARAASDVLGLPPSVPYPVPEPPPLIPSANEATPTPRKK